MAMRLMSEVMAVPMETKSMEVMSAKVEVVLVRVVMHDDGCSVEVWCCCSCHRC